MEPTNHPFRKEHDLPNLHDYGPCSSSRVYLEKWCFLCTPFDWSWLCLETPIHQQKNMKNPFFVMVWGVSEDKLILLGMSSQPSPRCLERCWFFSVVLNVGYVSSLECTPGIYMPFQRNRSSSSHTLSWSKSMTQNCSSSLLNCLFSPPM